MYRSVFLFIIAIVGSQDFLNAQLGFKAYYHLNKAESWEMASVDGKLADESILPDGTAFGVDYWFRLKNRRIEFISEITYAHYRQDDLINARFESSWYSFFLRTNIYPFDFFSDCDCPTFSKQESPLRRGFFVQLVAGLSWIDQRIEAPSFSADTDHLAFGTGLGLGYDLGLSNLITLTPTAGWQYYPSVEWKALDTFSAQIPGMDPIATRTSIQQWFAGLRLGLRWDYP
ncbi:MAG: autotransporter domain-containing protein [Saprospiraceae bacterium]|nr:autotransporter domain-containing protein [Saprospiraceae bacterium]